MQQPWRKCLGCVLPETKFHVCDSAPSELQQFIQFHFAIESLHLATANIFPYFSRSQCVVHQDPSFQFVPMVSHGMPWPSLHSAAADGPDRSSAASLVRDDGALLTTPCKSLLQLSML